MIASLLAQTASEGWPVVNALSVLLALAVASFALFRQFSGKGERQIEPTQLASIVAEMKGQTSMLNKLDREMGETKRGVEAVDDKITAQAGQVENAFRRINAISLESAALKGRFDDHLAGHREDRRHA